MTWVIRKTTKDSQGSLKLRYLSGLKGLKPEAWWTDDPTKAVTFGSQGEGNSYAIDEGIIFHYGQRNIDVVQYIGGH